MAYTVHLKRSAEKEPEGLPPKIHDKIIQALLSLRDNPFPRNSRRLRGRDGVRMRVGNYRVLYLVVDEAKRIDIISVAHRKETYR